MLRDSASRLVGLIEIEDDFPAAEDPSATGQDATLGEFLVHLARRGATIEAADAVDPPVPAHRFGSQGRMSADLQGLSRQLAAALVAARRRLAAAR